MRHLMIFSLLILSFPAFANEGERFQTSVQESFIASLTDASEKEAFTAFFAGETEVGDRNFNIVLDVIERAAPSPAVQELGAIEDPTFPERVRDSREPCFKGDIESGTNKVGCAAFYGNLNEIMTDWLVAQRFQSLLAVSATVPKGLLWRQAQRENLGARSFVKLNTTDYPKYEDPAAALAELEIACAEEEGLIGGPSARCEGIRSFLKIQIARRSGEGQKGVSLEGSNGRRSE